eukprot:gene9962-10117_t
MGLPDDDSLKDRKLDLLRAIGLGLCHFLSDGKHLAHGKEQQQPQLDQVLAAMTVAMCDDQQLLQPAVVQHIEQEGAQRIASKMKALSGSVSPTAAMLLEGELEDVNAQQL